MRHLLAVSLIMNSKEEVEKLAAAIEEMAMNRDNGQVWTLEVKVVEDKVVKQVVADRQLFEYFGQNDVK